MTLPFVIKSIMILSYFSGTVSIVQSLAAEQHCDTECNMSGMNHSRHGLSPPPLKSLEERYLEIMRALQFGELNIFIPCL